MQKNIAVSDRVEFQLPEFIREEDRQFVNFLFEYYKSQEKTGRPYDILNNLLNYLDLDNYSSDSLSKDTNLLKNIGIHDTNIEIESVDGFQPKDGSIMIDNEIIYYESITRGPDAIITPGVSFSQFNKKKQLLENPFSLFDGVRTNFPLSFLGIPVAPPSPEHLIIIVYNEMKIAGVDYFIEGDEIRFVVPPRARIGADDSEFTQITYLIGYADQEIITVDNIPWQEWQGTKSYPLRVNTQDYTPTSEIGLIINKNGRLQVPYEDYTVFNQEVIFKFPIGSADDIDIRSVEYVAPVYGSGASAIVAVSPNGQVNRVISKNGGRNYRLDFAPKIAIQSKENGKGATAKSLIDGIKDIILIDGGQGYTSYNPPIPTISAPSNPNGTLAKLTLTVNDTTGQVDQISIDNSGSGYDFIPAITFINPGGAKISDPTIDSEGRLNSGSIQVLSRGNNYTNPPLVYIDPAPDGGINAQAISRVDQDGQVYEISIVNRGRGYTTPPRSRIIDPIGAQVLDVTVASGSVTNIEMLTGGSGYTDAPSVYIVDDRKDAYGMPIGGTGATAVATIFNGEITDINITNFGEGYSDEFPPKVFIAEPKSARASVAVGFGEVTGFDIIQNGEGYSPSVFLNCSRGVSGPVAYDQLHNEIYAGESALRQSNHTAGTPVINLDSLFIREVFDKFRRQYLPTIEIDYSAVNPVQIVKSIKDFYISKGTKLATQYLFKIMFGEEIDVYYPKDEIISPSAANWVVDTILRAELISGDPNNLIDTELIQYADSVDLNVKNASALIENVISIIQGTDTIYELAISEETLSGTFVIPYKTNLVEPLTETSQIITVDSTIGWPERNGTILIGDNEEVQYKEKSLNQFIECTRSKNGIVEDWDPGTKIFSDIFVYTNRGTAQECKLRVLGIAEAGTTILDDTGSYYLPGDKLKVANLGSTAEGEKKLSSWLYNVKKLIQIDTIEPGGINNQTATAYCNNQHGLLVSDQVTIYGANPVVYNGTFIVTSRIDNLTFSYQLNVPTNIVPQGNILLSVDLNRGKSDVASINKVINEFTTNIQNSFFNKDYVYVAASGLPNYKIGPFTGSALIPGNQRKLLRFPRNVQTISERKNISPGTPIGSWINGVAIWSYKSREFVRFGPVTSIDVISGGIKYDAGNKPTLEISGGGGSGASAEVVINGQLVSFDVIAEGSGYTEQPLVSIVGGGGSGSTAQAIVTGGKVTRILVEQPGSGYTSQPSVSITGGGGTGATATANVRGPVESVNVTSFGSGYTDIPKIRLNSGEGALAQPIVINGRIVSIAIINSGSGYTTPPTVIINGDGFGAIAFAIIGTVGEDRGRVLGVNITNRGIGYTQGNTTIRLESVGENAQFKANVFEWNKNLQADLSTKFDFARGYVFTGYNNQFGGEYAHLSDPKELRYVVGDNVFLNPVTQQFQELTSNYKHSPILGWAFDGNPIYGPYGYDDPTDQNSGVRRLRTSYKLKTNIVFDENTNTNPSRIDGPSLTEYAAGYFIDDYFYDFQSGDLDNYNGRFCKTPDFPDGVYAYFITVDASDSGIAEFPYIIGPQFNSLPDNWNFSQGATQENIPADIVRFRDPYVDVDIDIDRQPNQESSVLTTEIEGYPIIFEIQDSNNDGLIDANEQQENLELSEESTLQIFDYFPQVPPESRVDIEVESTTQFEDAKIDGFVIENPGISYQVNDTVFFDNEGTGGFGASALIESVKGQKILGYTKEIIADKPYGVITTEIGHELRQADEIIVNSTPILDNTNKTFKVKVVAGIERINIIQNGSGYNEDIPPTFEIITSAGQDGQLQIVLENTGQINKVNIINSGNNYDPENPPEIRVSHPQQFKKTRYWLTEYYEATGVVRVNHSITTSSRNTYICGSISETDGDMSGFIAKFDDLGARIWQRNLLPQNAGQKRLEFIKMVIDEDFENDVIYLVGQSYNPTTSQYSPDVFLAQYEAGFNNANAPDGILNWQRSIAGISGSTRRDYVTSIALDQEKKIYICGYTDTNSPDPDDMWVIQCDIDGDIKEKRKIASEDGSERMHQIEWIANDTFFFVGVNEDNDDLIFGQFFFDGANIETDWIRQIPVIGGQVRNPKFTIDEYGACIVVWDVFNGTTSKFEKIQISKFLLSTANTQWEWSKTITLSTTYTSINNAGISVDVFGNYTLVSDVVASQNERFSTIHYLKYDGNIIKESKVEDATSVGFSAKNHTVDNSGDCIILSNRQKPDQLAAFRFNTTDDVEFDFTKQNLATWSYVDQANVTVDTTIYKYGTGSLKYLAGGKPASLTNFGLTPIEWSARAWLSMNTTAWSTAHQPTVFEVVPEVGNRIRFDIDGDPASPNYQKVLIYVNGTLTSSSTTQTSWSAFGAGAWAHITFQKRQESLGLYRYEVFLNGNLQLSYQSTDDIHLNDVVVGGPSVSPTTTNCFIGNIDDLVIDNIAPYENAYTVPTSEIAITTNDADVMLVKFDRLHTNRDEYALQDLVNYTNIAFSDIESITTWTTINIPAFAAWVEGPGGLQILDMSQVISTFNPTTYTLSTNKYQYASKTSTVPSPRGKRLIITSDVINKFYLKDASYEKIDNVLEFTLNQNAKLTKYSILQQFNSQGVTTAFGTIVDVPVGSPTNPGVGNKYKIGKIFGTFNITDRLRTTVEDVNQIIGEYFDTEEPESPWAAGATYAIGDTVYSNRRIYASQTAGVAGSISPQHTSGTASDGSLDWALVDDAGKFDIDLTEKPYPRPQYAGLDMPEWDSHKLYAVGQKVWWKLNVYQVAISGGGVSGTVAPTHTTGDQSDGGVTWQFVETLESIAPYARFMQYDQGNNYSVLIEEIHPGSSYIPGDVVSLRVNNIELDSSRKIVRIVGFASVKKIRVTARLEKDIIPQTFERTDLAYCTSTTPHFYNASDIIYTEGFQGNEFNGSFFVRDIIGSREFTFAIRDNAVSDPAFNSNAIGNVNIYAKHPTLRFTKNHQYNFDLSDASNFGYYLSFSQDNQYKLEYSFNNIVREGTPGIQAAGSSPFVKFLVIGDITNISYYFDPSRTGSNSPVGENSFIDVYATPYQGRFKITEIVNDFTFKFPLVREPEKTSAEVGVDDQDKEYSFYSTTSTRAIGPINTIKLVSPGGFYKKLPIIKEIASFRQIEKIIINDGGTEYAPGVYYDVPISGDGEGAKCIVTVDFDDEVGSGTITKIQVTDPGKGYTIASLDIDSIPGILGPTLAGSGASASVVIPEEGSGASVFLTGKNIGKIKRLKNNEFGFGYSHDYTLKPEIAFPVNLQLFNTSILSQIKITDPGSGYTSQPAVVIEGGGGSGAEAVAIVKNNRLNEIQIKNPGAGYSSEPEVLLKSEFNYVVNLDLNYLQFNFPHGITTGAAIQFRADDVGSTEGELPKPSSAGLTTLVAGQIYYAIAGEINSLDPDQIRFSLTPQSAAAGDYITFLTQGSGRQVLLTEVFGGKAVAVVETSRFLEGETVFQGTSLEMASAIGKVSTNTGWQIGPKILKIVDYEGDWAVGEKVNGVISKASGVIDNLSIARGVLNIGSLTKTPGKFIDDVGKPSEIVQKIQDSFFYQNFSYVIKSDIPITKWKTQILQNNHPAGFVMFGQLQLTGGKDISGRKIATEFTKQVNINNYANLNQITSFAAAQPIYTDFNNTEVLFRKKRLTSSEEILTSIVKKLDDVSNLFNGIEKSFPITAEGEQVIVSQDQLLITLNGVIQAPGESYQVVGGNIVFSEPPRPSSRVNYRTLGITPIPIYRIALYSGNIGVTNYGIFPTLGQQVQGQNSNAFGTVIDSGTNHIDVINITGGTFQLNEEITRSTLFSALVESVTLLNTETIFRFGESITNLDGDTAIIEEVNINNDGEVIDRVVVSKTSGTAEFETGLFDIRLNEFIYSASSKIAGQVTFISPYIDPATNDPVDELILNSGSTFYGLLFERLVSITNPNIILDDISKSSITPTELYDPENRINANFLSFEEVRSTEVTYTELNGDTFSAGDFVTNKKVTYTNPVSAYHGSAGNRFYDAANMIRGNKQEIIDFAEAEIAVQHPDFYFPGDVITNPTSRYSDSYRMIQLNKNLIVGMAYDDMITQYPLVSIPDANKCKRDLGHFVDALSIDIFRGGNVYTRKFTSYYFDDTGALVYVNAQALETRFAYERALEWMKQAITNQLAGTISAVNSAESWTGYQDLTITADPSPNDPYGTNGSNTDNTDPSSCSDVQDALTTLWEVVDTALGNGNLDELPDQTLGAYTLNETKCRRDIGYFIDAIANDVSRGGNYNIVTFTKFYFNSAGQPISNGLVGETAQSITAFEKARDISYSAINNLLYYKDLTLLNDPASYGGTAPGYTYDTNYDTGSNQLITNCADVQSYIATLTDIAVDAISAGNLNNVNALATINDGTYTTGENIRSTKIAYKDKSSGLFTLEDQIKGVSSGAIFKAIGTNAGLKWIYAGPITGTFQIGEYITNSTLTNQGGVTQSVIVKKAELTGTKSLNFPAAGYLAAAESYNFEFGATNDFTIEAWIRPSGNSGTQHLFDFRRSVTSGLRVIMDGQQLRVYNGSSALIISGNAFTTVDTWYHVSVVRINNVLQAYVNGVQVGANYADTNDYGYAPCYVGSNFQGLTQFTGHMDNVYVKNGTADHISTFTPPTQVDYTDNEIVLGLNGEGPFILSTTETYATLSSINVYNATAKVVNYDDLSFVIKDVDLGRKEYRDSAEIISLNAAWIAEEAVGRMKAQFPDFIMPGDDPSTNSYGGTNYCLRDTKDYIIAALVKDLKDGGNYNTLYTARTYLSASGKLKHVGNEILQTLYTWDEVSNIMVDVITTTSNDLTGQYTEKLRIPNNFDSPASQSVQDEIRQLTTDMLEVIAPSPNRFRDSGILIWKNRDYIADEVVGYIQDKYVKTLAGNPVDFLDIPGGDNVCKRDIKTYIIPAIIADLATGGTYQTQNVIDFYLDSQQNILFVENELNPMLDAFNKTKELCQFAVNNLLLNPGSTAAEATAPSWAQDDYYEPQYTSRVAYTDNTITIDDEGYPQLDRNRNDRYIDATNLIKANKELIAKEAVATMNDLSKFGDFNIPGGSVNCEDDVKDVLDALVHDLLFDCNDKIYEAASMYIEPENNSLRYIETEWEASVTTFKIVRDIATLTMRNAFGRDYIPGTTLSGVPVESYEQNPREYIFADCGDAIDGNIRYIAEQAVYDGQQQYPGLVIPNGAINCIHDVADILKALVFNLKYGGDNWMQYAAEFYVNYSGNLEHITSQTTETIWILNRARDLAIKAIKDAPITNNAGYTGSQRFYDATPNPTNQLRNSSPLGIDNTSYNNTVTRTFAAGKIDIQNADNTSIGMDNSDDFTARCVTVLPSGTPTDSVLFEGGGAGYGTWLGFRDGGTYLRFRAGSGGNAYSGGASYTSDTGLAMLDIPVADLVSAGYMDGNQHELVWEVRIGGNVATGPGRVRLFIDGNLVGAATTPGSLNTGLAAGGGAWSEGDNGGFAATAGGVPNGEPTTAWPYTITGTMGYYRARLVSVDYTGNESDDVISEITSLMSKVTDGIQNPSNVSSRIYTLPTIWPIKYTPEISKRDLTITYDSISGGSGSDGTWYNTCGEVASAIDTLMEMLINTIEEAANNNINYLTANVTRTFKPTNNTEYQLGTCYDVVSAVDTLFTLMIETLGAGPENTKRIANMILFNETAIATRAFNETTAYYGTTNLTIDFCYGVLKAVRYDMITGGNAGSFEFLQDWFDGEGNFIAFAGITRSHILYCLTRIREYIKSVMYLLDTDSDWTLYTTYNPIERLEWFQEAAEFIVDSSLNPIEFALERSKFPTEAKVTFIASSDAVNLANTYEMGIDYNTDPALVTLLPLTEVGYERAEYRVRINRSNSFRRGDILQYIPASETSLAGMEVSDYFYVINAEATWFEIGTHYIHDGRFKQFEVDTANSGAQILQVDRRSGINLQAPIYPGDPSETPVLGGFNSADVIYGVTSEAHAEIGVVQENTAKIFETFTRYELNDVSSTLGVYDNFINGEQVVVQGATSNNGYVFQTAFTNNDGETFVNLILEIGTISIDDVIEGIDSGCTATVVGIADKLLLNIKSGDFAANQWMFDKDSSTEAYISEYTNKTGVLSANSGGRITIDVETIQNGWNAGDVIYGSLTDYILDVKGISGTQIQLNQYIHGTNVYQLELGSAIVDTGVADTFRVGDEVSLLQGTTIKNPGFVATVTQYINDPDLGIHRLFIANLVPVGIGADISEITVSTNNIGKINIGSNFPTIYANVNSYTNTEYTSYGKVVAIEQSGITARIWVENANGEFVNNMTVKSDSGWGGAVSKATILEGRVDRYFRGFDGVQTAFDLTINNGEAYFPDPAGHLLVFVNAVLQPPGAGNSYIAFSDKVQFTEPPEIGSEFIGYYVGKLRQLDDISFEFDSLRSSFNLKRDGLFYSLTLTEGASSNTILPENNIIVSLNGIIQEPGVSYELVGSRIIFSEVPRSGSTFVGFSYIGSDNDVIAATVVPPVESGDQLFIEGEEFNREVAVIESSNSLVTFEYTGSVKGRSADALAEVTSGQLNNAILTNPGDGYTSRPNVDVISSTGFDGKVKALMGITRIDVRSAGVGYQQPIVAIDNEVPDDFTTPVGTPINGGIDIYNPEENSGGGGIIIIPGTIAISKDPVNVTVNQGQTAVFTVSALVSNDETLNYQWQKKEYGTVVWSNIIGANQSAFSTGNTTQNDDGDEYRVAITAVGATPVYSLSAIISVQTGATVIVNFTPTQIFDDI